MNGSGFRPGMATNSGKGAMYDFMMALATAPEGTNYEVGLTWDAENKWRVYQRIGDKALMMDSDTARKLHRTYEKMMRRPEWRNIGDSMIETIGQLKTLASEAYHKNKDGVVPEGGVQYMQPGGRA